MRLDHILSGKHKQLIDNQLHEITQRKNKRATARVMERIKADPQVRMRARLRTRVRSALRAKKASRVANMLLGCTQAELIAHIESQFTEGMSWDNYGKWHIDHIKPCAKFNLLLADEQRKCFHYTNLQPLWARANQSKGCR